MPDKAAQPAPKWSRLPLWHEPEFEDEGRYSLEGSPLEGAACRLCGGMVLIEFLMDHAAYHMEQGY